MEDFTLNKLDRIEDFFSRNFKVLTFYSSMANL